jgi:hypothetical protein
MHLALSLPRLHEVTLVDHGIVLIDLIIFVFF